MSPTRRLLLYRLGSLGDTAAILPCFHLIARAFPDAERYLLTNLHGNSKASTIESVLEGTGLVHGSIAYPRDGLRSFTGVRALRDRIRAFAPDALVYMLEQRHTRSAVLRDAAFFKACGIPRILGVPLRRDLFEHRFLPARRRFENQAERLARCLAPLGDARLGDPTSWDLKLAAAERDRASMLLGTISAAAPVIACCPGTKIDVKDWGEENWTRALRLLSGSFPTHAIVFIGSHDERDRCERLRAVWTGPSVNLCGDTTPREAAAVIARCGVYLGHDTGPMHLAAAAGIPCVAVFSARNKPGEWYPHGDRNRILYRQVACFDCRLETCVEYGKECISSITPDDVVEAFTDAMARTA